MNLDNLLRFAELMHTLQSVKRATFVNGEDRKENDIEHQYQLAILAWYIIDSENLSFDKDLVIQYALIHDVVEVYAGDTYFFGDRTGKEERERASAERLKIEFPEFKDLHVLIEKYERQEDRESKFVYALDKLVPVINIYLDKGRTWKHYGVTREMLVVNKAEKIKGSEEVKAYFDEMIIRLKEDEPELFAVHVGEQIEI